MDNPGGGTEGQHKSSWRTAVCGSLAFGVVGLGLAMGLVRVEPAPAPPAAMEPAPLAVDAPKASRGPLAPAPPAPRPESTAFDCMILPSEVIEIGSPIAGLIEEVPVERSEYVESGQVVARLESSVERAAVRVARARADRRVELESSKANLELGEKRRKRAADLFDADSLSLDTRDEVETEATLAALALRDAQENQRIAAFQLEQARATLARRTIRSPISGFVVERLMAPGEVVDEQTIMRIAQIDPLRVDVILPSHWVQRLKPGDRAEVIPEGPLDEVYNAEVSIVDPIVDGASGTFSAQLTLPNPERQLTAGLRCQLRFVTVDSVAQWSPSESADSASGEAQMRSDAAAL